MPHPDVITALVPVVRQLERLEAAYYVGGSLASSAHGVPRTSLDADVVADLMPAHVTPLVEALEAEYYVSLPAIRDAVARRTCFNVIHYATAFKVDVFALNTRPYDRQALGRARREVLDEDAPDARFMVASPEDTILSKLEWFRLGGGTSERQWLDVLGVLAVQGEGLDFAYMEHWAPELGVADLLDRARREVGG